MKKKALVLFMVCILALPMSAAVFAAGSSEITIDALYREVKIEVNVPSTGQMYLNPESLPLIINGRVEDAQIINTPWSIENRSECAISVNAKVHAVINKDSTMKLSEHSLSGSADETKQVFIYLDKRVTDPDTDLSSLDWDRTEYDSEVQMLVSETGLERNDVMTLAGAGGNGSASAGGVGAFRLGGDAIANPAGGWNPTVDNVAVHITFTFRPTVVAPAP